MQPLLFVFVFAYVFPKIGQGFHGGANGVAFSTILVPGLIAVAINFQGIQAVALPLVQEFSISREIEDRVLAPVPVWVVGFEKIFAGAMQANSNSRRLSSCWPTEGTSILIRFFDSINTTGTRKGRTLASSPLPRGPRATGN